MADDRKALAVSHEVADQMPLRTVGPGKSLLPQTAGEMMEFAKMMAAGQLAVPEHVRGNPGACLRVIDDALRFALSPYHLADESFIINKRLCYSAKAIHAMTLNAGVISGRLRLSFKGEGEALCCTVTGRIQGDGAEHVKSTVMSQITTRNSPLWKTDPRQQLGYYTERAWCRLYAPDAMMGLIADTDPPIDVTPAGGGTLVDSDVGRVEALLGPEEIEAAEDVDDEGDSIVPAGPAKTESEIQALKVARDVATMGSARLEQHLASLIGPDADAIADCLEYLRRRAAEADATIAEHN